MKRCARCLNDKPKEEFSRNSTRKDGLRAYCKTCSAEDYSRYRQENISKEKERHAQYYLKNKELYGARSLEWRKRNPEKYNKSQELWKEKNKGYWKNHYAVNKAIYVIKATDWRNKNREMASMIRKRWEERNPEKLLAKARNRRALEAGAEGKHSARDVYRIFESQKGRCVYCRVNLTQEGKGKMHIDHVIPLAKGGTNWPSNLQLLCPACNLSKGAKDPFVFAQGRGMLV